MFFSQQKDTQETKKRRKNLILQQRLSLLKKMKYCGKLLSFSTPFTFQPNLHLLNYCAMTPTHVYCCIFQVLTPLVDKLIIFFHPQMWKILGSLSLTYMFLKGI
jgi:hypothetical protein